MSSDIIKLFIKLACTPKECYQQTCIVEHEMSHIYPVAGGLGRPFDFVLQTQTYERAFVLINLCQRVLLFATREVTSYYSLSVSNSIMYDFYFYFLLTREYCCLMNDQYF